MAWGLEEHLLLVQLGSVRIHLHNPAATALWLLLLDATRDRESLLGAYAELFGESPARIGADLAPVLNQWLERGWVQRAADGRLALARHIPPEARAPAPPVCAALPPHTLAFEGGYQLGTTTLGVRLGGSRAARLAGAEAWSERLIAMLAGLPQAARAPAAELQIVTSVAGIYLQDEAGRITRFDTPTEVLDQVLSALLRLGYPQRPLLAKLHAAALGLEGQGTIVFPAVSGSGKSTLASHLAGCGWEYCGDDIVGLAACGTVLPLPTAANLKEGSWPVLRERFPALDTAPQIEYGFKTVRYLALPRAAPGRLDAATLGLAAWVLPTFEAGAATRLSPLSAVEALQGVLAAGLSLEGGGEVAVAALLAQLAARPRYRLIYSRLNEAEACLRQLLAPR